MLEIIGGLLLAYVLGSIPSAVWIGKSFFGKDVRDFGSGNAGATNTFRVLGWKPGSIVFIIDTIKGFLAVFFVSLTVQEGNEFSILLTIIAGIFAVVGHIFPVFASFKGGKGVATMLGITLGIHPFAAAIALSVFIVVFLISRYVSLGSLAAGISFPLLVFFVFKVDDIYLQLFSVLLAVILFYSHKANIRRLIEGTESPIKFSKK